MKEEIRALKNHVMFIDQCVVRLTVYEEVRKVNVKVGTGSFYSDEVGDYLIREVKNFANNYDDEDDRVYTLIDDVYRANLKSKIEELLWHYAVKKKDALERLFLLS